MDLDTHVADLRALHAARRPAGIPAETVYPLGEITIPAYVTGWAQTRPDHIALALEETSYTYAQLDDAHRRLASWMAARGVTRGDRVAVHLGNSTEFVIAFLAVLRLGAVHVPVNPMFQAGELAHELNDAEPVLIITSRQLTPALDASADRVAPITRLVVDEPGAWGEALASDPYANDDGDLDSLAALNYTGGTTGLPKGCQHSQRHMLYTAASATTATGIPADGSHVGLCFLPVFWIAGEDLGILLPIVVGGTSILMRRWDAATTVDLIEANRVTLMVGTVENYLEMIDLGLQERDLDSLQDPQAVSFVRKMTPEVRRQWAEAVPGSVLRESAYGMTETHTIDAVPYGFAEDDLDLRAEPVFCGIPVPGTDIAVVGFGTQTPVPLGEVGEIVVRSPSVTDGYWRNPDATAEQLVDGWIHTGDNGRIDEDGFLHYLGREKEMIKVNGMSVFPADVEVLLAQYPGVDSVAVVPTDDPERGQRPVAFVTTRPGASVTAEEITAWSRDTMAAYKVPVVSVVGSLPMTTTGKVRKNELPTTPGDSPADGDSPLPSPDESGHMTLLIANRGEIAERITRAAMSLDWSVHRVHAADEPAPTPSSHRLDRSGVAAYLDVEGIVAAAVAVGATHLHPGYGFLSESAELARACADAGVVFVGPSPEVLELFGDKGRARAHAQSLGVPVMAATAPDADLEQVRALFAEHGEGIMIKATAGGGGRGMRQVFLADEVEEAYEACRSEARRAFGIDTVYAERLMTEAKHIEVQVLGDGTGAVVTLGERECSVQRRHQKVLELAPSPSLTDGERAVLVDHARRLIQPLGYLGLATVEFLVSADTLGSDDGSTLDLAFIEVNPRVQVEHTVTEEVLGIDLVVLQLQVAAGRSVADLGVAEDRMPPHGVFAIQSRVNAERVHSGGAVATTGTVSGITWPDDPRVDSHARPGLVVDGTFDSLLAKVITRTEGTWPQACRDADAALAALRIEGIETNIGLLRRLLADPQVAAGTVTTDHVDSLLALEAETGQTAGADDPEHLVSPFAGTVVALGARVDETIGTRTAAITLEAMKMEHPLRLRTPATITAWHVAVGDQVAPGDRLATVAPAANHAEDETTGDDVDLDHIRPDLAEVHERRRLTRDEARPAAVAKRHARGHLMARQWLHLLLDEDTFLEYGTFPVAAQRSRRTLDDLIATTPADGIVTGTGRVDDGEVAVLAYDYTVLAGTQGYFNHQKTDRMLGIAKDRRIPVVLFAEGGGGRPGDTDTADVLASGLGVHTFAMLGSLSGQVPVVGVVTGRCFAGNAALLGSCEVIIATRDANIGMAGPAMIEGGGLGSHRPEDIGPTSVQSPNGVIDVLVDTDAEAIGAAQQYLSYFRPDRSEWTAADQRHLRHVVGENRKQVYDVRELITTLADDDSVLELRRDFGIGAITALVRVEGKPMGLVANDPAHLGGAIDADAADKMARFLQLCDAHGLPVVSLCDTPGFMVGPTSEETATVRHFGRLFVIGAHLRIPLITIVVRKAYGLGAQAMAAGGFGRPLATIAWPTGEIGGMGLEGAVRLGYSKELAAIVDLEQREVRYQELLDQHYETGKAINGAMKQELDEVIDPADTRRWIMDALGGWQRGPVSGGRYIDTW